MKVIILSGSPRKNGNTERLAKLVEQSLVRRGERKGIAIEAEHLPLSVTQAAACRGCRACFEKGENSCPIKDDLLSMYGKLLGADAAVFLSPVYVEDVTGIMKNLIDRLAFCCHRPAFGGKVAAVLTTSGGGSTKHALQTMDRALHAWGYSVEASGMFRMGALMKKEEMERLYTGTAEKIADRLLAGYEKKRQSKHSFISLLYFKIQQTSNRKHQGNDNPDSRYWGEREWLNPRRTYYCENRTSPLITALARGAGALMALFFV